MTRQNNPFFELLKIENRPDQEIRDQLRKIFSGAISLDNYYVFADGVTDDSAQIQEAIDDSGGNEVVFGKNKTYLLDSRLNVPDNTEINLNGSTIKLGSADRGFLLTGDNVSIKNGTINCNNQPSGITGLDKDFITLRDIEIVDADGRGCALTNCSYVRQDNVNCSWTSAGVLSRVSNGNSFYGLLATSLDITKQTVHYRITNCTVDFSNYTASQMQTLDAGFIIRGDETGAFNYADFISVKDCKILMPVGELGVTYGTGLPRPTGLEIRTANNVYVENVYTTGGDLTITFGRVLNLSVVGCTSLEQTNYCIELASGCDYAFITNCYFESSESIRPISCTGGGRYYFNNTVMKGGAGSGECLVVSQNDSKVYIENSLINPTVDGTNGICLINGGSCYISNTEFYTESSTAGWFLISKTGTNPYASIKGCTFEGSNYGPVDTTSALTFLRVSDSDGIGSLASSDLALVTTGQYNDNTGLTGM